ncbi:hypothetical protein MBLNU459_g3072t1 [Dothideomycetes sp. NU459]
MTSTRPYLRRGSPLSVFAPSQGFSADAPMIQRIDVGDSSDDDIPQPMKFSALTKALLESEASPPKQDVGHASGQIARLAHADKAGVDTPSRAPLLKIVRKNSPVSAGDNAGATHRSPRIVQIGSARRVVSVSDRQISRSREGTPASEFVTPAPASRAARLARSRTEESHSPAVDYDASVSRPGSGDAQREHDHDHNHGLHSFSASQGPETGTYHAPSTLARSRNTSAESAAPPGSMRVKRVPIGAGSFLRGAPVRRGFRRRESDDHPSPNEEHEDPVEHPGGQDQHGSGALESAGSRSRSDSMNMSAQPISRHDFAQSRGHSREIREPSRHKADVESPPDRSNAGSRQSASQANLDQHQRHPSLEPRQRRDRSNSVAGSHHSIENAQRRPSNDHMGVRPTLERSVPQRQDSHSYRAPLKTHVMEDQENMPPPTFRRNKDHDFKYLGKSEKVSLHANQKPRTVADTPVPVPANSSPRRALAAMSNNTPVRPAPPPPPKMSVLDAATKTAGASTTKKKKRSHILVNGKLFTQMNKIGKGGSSDVYCVMAENYKLFALKKVKLEDCDETAMVGFKGEIDLLQKLADVDRVVRLFDWELDNEKQILSVLMEKGDNDLNRILTIQLNGTDPRFDPVLTRFFWKEMLECVQAVHDYDIVHSDLKPANFLSVQGKLKLIDFGIANAIDIDNTVNVHRDSHIGTPNYMSPESITDTNAPTPGSARDVNGGRIMKLGKPSDVWSLGCILYQMVYGRPPFAHIPNQISRIMAITNSRVVIEYPNTGVGGVAVPVALKNTLRRCLQRDASARPTVKQLLSAGDPWLYPEAAAAVAMTEELLAQIIDKVVERCRDPKRGVPSQDEVRQYPASFMAKIREMVEREGVKEGIAR